MARTPMTSEIWIDGTHHDGVFLSLRRVEPDQWAVVHRGRCLNREGEWEHEPMPSSRDEAFFARCRWESSKEAQDAYAQATRKPVDSGASEA